MFDGNETTHIGSGWKSVTDQYSNKGAIILMMDSDGNELFRILYDVATKKLKINLMATGEKLEIRT